MMPWLIGAAIACGLTGIISYALYVRARMREDERAEARYLQVHYIALFLLFAVGVVVMFYMGAYSD